MNKKIPLEKSIGEKGFSLAGFTLLELLLVVTVIVILALIAIPGYNKSKNRAIGKEAVANLKLIAAAERIYKMENDSYITCVCTNSTTCAASTGCNSRLRLMLNTSNWQYGVTGSATAVTVTATYKLNSSCKYNIYSSNFDLDPVKSGAASCP
ncbi:MAG: prepilin-type N-terminal cleavage/methylation domain-containing protein [Candidatus Omnitrophota bacterium]